MPTYPLEMPEYPAFTVSRFGLERTVASTESPFSKIRYSQEHTGRPWRATVTLPSMTRDDAAEWEAFFLQCRGTAGNFWFGSPDHARPRGAGGGGASVVGDGQKGDRLLTEGWVPNTKGILLKGDMFQCASKMHAVVEDADADESGRATLVIEPEIVNPYVSGTGLTVEGPVAVFHLLSNLHEFTWDADGLTQPFTFPIREDLSVAT